MRISSFIIFYAFILFNMYICRHHHHHHHLFIQILNTNLCTVDSILMNKQQHINASPWKNTPPELIFMIIEHVIRGARERPETLRSLQVNHTLRFKMHRALRSKICHQLAKVKYEEDRQTLAGRSLVAAVTVTSTPDTVAAVTADRREQYIEQVGAIFQRCLFGVFGDDEPKTEADLLRCKPLDFYSYLCRPAGVFQRRFEQDLDTNAYDAVSALRNLLVQYHNSTTSTSPPMNVSIYKFICACGGPMANHLLSFLLEQDFTYLNKQGLRRAHLMPRHRNALLLACLDGLTYRASLRNFKRPSQTASIIGYLCANRYVKWTAINIISKRALTEQQITLSEYMAEQFSGTMTGNQYRI